MHKRISLSMALFFVLLVMNGQAEMVIIEGDGYAFDVIEVDQREILARKTADYLDARTGVENGRIALKNPPTAAKLERERRVDVIYTYPYDVIDKDGKLLRRAGDRFNPLASVSIPELIVVSGKSEKQLTWAETFKKQHLAPTAMILLSDGNWITVRKELGLEVYRLSERLQARLQITHVPCTVMQDGEEVVIHEYDVEELN